jgi:antitoxin (DNA-binding transcriptional repressor) of toxin-antitoxin stability system
MEVTITQFRRDIFALVGKAAEGAEVWITHKGKRFRIVPEDGAGDKLSRITPMQVLIPDDFDLNDPVFKAEMMAEMEKEWEHDWEML